MTDDDRDYEPTESNDPPTCIDCNDQDEQVWDEYNHKWKCKRCAFPGEIVESDGFVHHRLPNGDIRLLKPKQQQR